YIRPERAKALIIKYLHFFYIPCVFMLLPLQGAECRCLIPGVPLRSAPGYVLVAPLGRVLI
ncbi:hypothetical protein, partial [Xylanibacter rodentium]|uniref:hypothetical protein n=1 Tax=Xylanibacter rodentium TaxID=2736289 RepID=UPI0025875C4A